MMMNITLTKKNFIEMIPLLYTLTQKKGALHISVSDRSKSIKEEPAKAQDQDAYNASSHGQDGAEAFHFLSKLS